MLFRASPVETSDCWPDQSDQEANADGRRYKCRSRPSGLAGQQADDVRRQDHSSNAAGHSRDKWENPPAFIAHHSCRSVLGHTQRWRVSRRLPSLALLSSRVTLLKPITEPENEGC
jgi:hypothetical protein